MFTSVTKFILRRPEETLWIFRMTHVESFLT